ncbi:hypothetical protein DL764_005211 [Monosporascus ibericus]|uniref:Peptidase S53 domain-containing protein n=1 Tax=Monosporascus ibericus TaxID=155417 RepID=A0A4Q4TA26_9PEZI|nr:hypothetical protein DL764_005211 [Monosporascus ibericus]
MRCQITCLLFTLLARSFAGIPTTGNGAHAVHEKRTQTAQVWKRLPTSISPDTILPLAIALAQENLGSAEDELLSVSDPSSPHFARYWSSARVAAHFSATDETFATVTSWLEMSGIYKRRLRRSNGGDWILFNATIQEAEMLLKTKYHLFARQDGQETHLGCDEYSLPESVRRHVDFVMPTVHLGAGSRLDRGYAAPVSTGKFRRTDWNSPGISVLARRQATRPSNASLNLSNCHRYLTPNCLRSMYHLPASDTSHPANSFGIFQPSLASWLPTDLDAFFSLFAPSLIGHRPVMVNVNGGYWQDHMQNWVFNLEADLDFEYAMTLSAPLPVINYQVGTMANYSLLSPLLAAFNNFYCNVLNTSANNEQTDASEMNNVITYDYSDCGALQPPAVLSVSYADNEAAFPSAYLHRQCIEFLKLGLMGTTVIVASGDCGPSGQACECVDPVTGWLKEETDSGAFGLTSPASCPYVTAVGGTQLPPNGSVSDREVAFRYARTSGVSSSGGGFSRVFPVPAYQVNATAKYLASEAAHLRPISSFFNPEGRGVPDVSAHAANYATAVNGKLRTVFGTSASAPVFASIIAMMNNARLRAGKTTVGFLNPVLYSNQVVMSDVVQGGNHGCGKEAFRAREGWDPVTGLGTPDFRKLVDLYLSLP